MPRSIRIEYPGAFYHVMARGNRREAIFADEDDRRFFALVPKVSKALWERIGEAKLRFGGRRVSIGTAFEVVVRCNGDGVSAG